MSEIKKQLSAAYDRLDLVNDGIIFQERSLVAIEDRGSLDRAKSHLSWLKTVKNMCKKEVEALERKLKAETVVISDRELSDLKSQLWPS